MLGLYCIVTKKCCFWISKLLYLDFQFLLSTEVVTRLSHDQVVLFKMFRGTARNYARQTINHAAWWAKPQVYGFAEVVKREYRSNRELFNLIYF